MADTLSLEIATPERLLVQADATEVYIPAANGMIGILPQHAPLLSALGIGELAFVTSQGRRTVFIADGWVQVLNDQVRVLADRAEDIGEIDTGRAEAALKRARERLSGPPDVDVARAINAARRAEARLAAARAHRPM